MNDLLHALAELNLRPGQCKRIQVNGYQLEIRRPWHEKPSELDDMVMLEPWVELPRPTPIAILKAKPGTLPPPDPPTIPPDDEGSVS